MGNNTFIQSAYGERLCVAKSNNATGAWLAAAKPLHLTREATVELRDALDDILAATAPAKDPLPATNLEPHLVEIRGLIEKLVEQTKPTGIRFTLGGVVEVVEPVEMIPTELSEDGYATAPVGTLVRDGSDEAPLERLLDGSWWCHYLKKSFTPRNLAAPRKVVRWGAGLP